MLRVGKEKGAKAVSARKHDIKITILTLFLIVATNLLLGTRNMKNSLVVTMLHAVALKDGRAIIRTLCSHL